MNATHDFYSPGGADAAKWESRLLRLLSSPRTRSELETRLRDLGCPEEIALELLDRFERDGLVDDLAYAVLYVDSKRDFGARRLRDELRARGVSGGDISRALDECGFDEEERARSLAARLRHSPGMTAEKLAARLVRRGFSSSSVRAALEDAGDFPGDDG